MNEHIQNALEKGPSSFLLTENSKTLTRTRANVDKTSGYVVLHVLL